MLASTVQFSTNNQPPPPTGPTQPDPRPPGDRRAGDVRPGTALTRQPHRHPRRGTGSAPSGPIRVPTNPTPAARPPHPAPEGTTAVLANRPRPASELVSVPPSSTTPDTRGLPRIWATVTAWA